MQDTHDMKINCMTYMMIYTWNDLYTTLRLIMNSKFVYLYYVILKFGVFIFIEDITTQIPRVIAENIQHGYF